MATTRIGRKELGSYKTRFERAQESMKRFKKKSGKVVEQAVHTAEVSSAAFVAGVIQGRKGSVEIFGAPLEAVAAVLLHGAAFMGLGGKKAAQHLHGFGDGFAGSYFTMLGRTVGDNWKAKAVGGASGDKADTKKVKGSAGWDLPAGEEGSELDQEDMYYAQVNAIP